MNQLPVKMHLCMHKIFLKTNMNKTLKFLPKNSKKKRKVARWYNGECHNVVLVVVAEVVAEEGEVREV